MKKLFLMFILVLSKVICASPSQADWKRITKGSNGHVFYINTLSIEEKEGKVYFWQLIDYLKPDEYGDLSAQIYIESDCVNLRLRWINFSYHKAPMGIDNTIKKKPNKDLSRWQVPSPYSASKAVLDFVCSNTGITL